MKRHKLAVLLALIATIVPLGLVSCSKTEALLTGMERSQHPPKLQIVDHALQAALDRVVADKHMPGAVLLIATPQQTWVGAAGFSNLSSQTPMQPSSKFGLASASKLYVAVTVLQLVDAGQVDLDQAIVNYLPQEVSSHIPNSDRITVRQLLNHTSGVAEYLSTSSFGEDTHNRDRANPWTAKEAIAYIYDQPPQADPGEKFIYTDSNYILLELIVETVTGKPLETVVRDRILTPLGLNNTFTELREAVPGGMATGYSGPNAEGVRSSYSDQNLGNGLGDGGLVATAQDAATFLQALLVQHRLLSPQSLKAMLTFVDNGTGGYGLGIQRWQDSSILGDRLGHSGNFYGYQSLLFYLPQWNATIVALTNGEDAAAQDVATAGLTAAFTSTQP